ncbi:MAG: dTDP-4-amino-4,6-dideoxygalactose transaminase [Bacteroidetes bacterium]|nr:MAG: dTDP-4-amino-4,6-dideoxygalactose transaminase [Bacteroidota bacterium]
MNKYITNFNIPHLTGKEVHYIYDAVFNKQLSGNGKYTKLCHQFFQNTYQFKKVLLTSSCTDALEMCALLINIQPGDEVIMPSYTFVSTANAFVLRGAKIIFADSYAHHPNMNADAIEELITSKTKAIVVMHYAGVANDMDKIISIAQKYNLYVIEDAAQAIDSYYIKGNTKIPLGSIGNLGAMSFHETKNIISGEGGMLIVNDEQFVKRSEILWEKGTNRSAFFRGEVDKYGWVDVGSSFLPSELTAAFLYAQLEHLSEIQQRRTNLWNNYYEGLKGLEEKGYVRLPYLPPYATNNAHMFYLVCQSLEERTKLIQYLKEAGIQAVFHYLSLHRSPFYKDKHDGRELPYSDMFSDCLVRLPMYYDLDTNIQNYIIETICNFYRNDK